MPKMPRPRELTGGTDSLGSFSSHGMHPSSCPPWPQCARVALPLAVLYLSHRFEYAVTMDREMSGMFERAVELARDLLAEYDACAQAGQVSERAKNLFHEIMVKLRSALDITMNRLFVKSTSLAGSKRANAGRSVYFPICRDETEFNEKLRGWGLQHLQQIDPALYDKLRQSQPFASNRQDLLWLRDFSNQGKHVSLARQDCEVKPAKRVTMPNGAVLIFTDGVAFKRSDGTTIEQSQLGDVEDVTMANFEVSGRQSKMWDPGVKCLSYCQDCRRYIEKLLLLIG